jgi:hypothetical protein
MATKDGRKTGGRRKGSPNKLTADVKAMVQGALDDAGGQKYLTAQAKENPKAFLTLVGKLLPLQLTGAGGKDLISPPAQGVDWLGYPIAKPDETGKPV